ncbi:MAG: hypothetical protein WA976_04630 [Candidatus Dormiibacterota bacterium]
MKSHMPPSPNTRDEGLLLLRRWTRRAVIGAAGAMFVVAALVSQALPGRSATTHTAGATPTPSVTPSTTTPTPSSTPSGSATATPTPTSTAVPTAEPTLTPVVRSGGS